MVCSTGLTIILQAMNRLFRLFVLFRVGLFHKASNIQGFN